jgi:hypothetical protein
MSEHAKVTAELLNKHIFPLLAQEKLPELFFPPAVIAALVLSILEGKATYSSAKEVARFLIWAKQNNIRLSMEP